MSNFADGIKAGRVAGWLMEIPSGDLFFDDIKALQLGYKPEDFTHYRHFTDLVHPDDYERMMQDMRDLLEGRKPMYKTQYRIKAADGTWHIFMDQGTIQKREGDNISVFGATVDIT